MKLKDLIAGIPQMAFSGNGEEEIQGISYSSKNINSNFLFAAVKGEKKDGFDFISEALSLGATAILSEKPKPKHFPKNWIQVADVREALALCSANFYDHPSQKMKVIGVTGTKGKTTVTYLLEEILKKSHFHPGVIGTIEYRGPKTQVAASRTTPEAPDIQKMIKEFLEQGVTHCLLEVSSHALELKRVVGIGFDITVFMNLSGDHLDFHHSMDNYFEAKKRLFFFDRKKKTAMVNIDDPWGKKLIKELPPRVITFGLNPTAMVKAEKFDLTEKGIKSVIRYPAGKFSISSPLLGKPNLYNALASIAVSLTLNLPIPRIQEGLSSLKEVPGRFEKIDNSLGLHIFVDYAHTDGALRNLLETIRELNPKRIIVIFGAGGDRDKTKRARMGEAAGELADLTIVTSDNPRSEDPLAIIADIEKGLKKTGTKDYIIIPDRKEAIKYALSLGEKGDYVLVAGKGHENYQIIKDKVIPYNDAEFLRKILYKKELN